MSSYIVDREPGKYGGQQQQYVTHTTRIVGELVASFKKATEEKRDMTVLFHEILSHLGSERQKIAQEHQSKDAQFFGLRRDTKENFPGIGAMTPLSHCYQAYSDKLIPVLQKYLRTMQHTLKEFTQRELSIPLPRCHGRNSSMNITIFSVENKETWAFMPTYENFTHLSKLCNSPPPPEDDDVTPHFNAFLKDRNAMTILKEKSIQQYKSIKVSICSSEMYKRTEWKKSDWVIVTLRLEVGGKMFALSQYLTWMYRDFRADPVENMTGKSVIGLIHQDVFLVETMLQDIAKVFKDAIECNRENLDQLKKTCALFQYELAHTMPFARGTAAISEWLEMAIFQFHGYSLTYNKDKMVNLEALTSPLSEFVQNYDTMIVLNKIQE